jgi:TPR repeat protein
MAVEQNTQEAIKWLREAAKQGYTDAQEYLKNHNIEW